MNRAQARKVAMQLIYMEMFGMELNKENYNLSCDSALNKLENEDFVSVDKFILDNQSNINAEFEDQVEVEDTKFEVDNYVNSVVNGVLKNSYQIDEFIIKYLHNWTIDRIAKVDLAIIKLSVYEMLFCDDIPNNVSINEAVKLGKEYSTDKSARFINGILGSISRDKKLTDLK